MNTFTKTLLFTTSAAALSSCSSIEIETQSPWGSSKPETAIAKANSPKVQWYQVKKSPPSYFPKGLSKSSPTSAYHGFWVSPGNGSQWFVPSNGINGLTATQLRADVMRRNTKQVEAEKISTDPNAKVIELNDLDVSAITKPFNTIYSDSKKVGQKLLFWR